MKLTITPTAFEELVKKSYSLDLIYLLKLIDELYDVKPMCEGSVKMATLYSSLIRRGWITAEEKITTIGQELLVFIDSKETAKLLRRKPATDEFNEWWNHFPSTNNFQYKGKTFTGERALKKNKDECRLKFDKILIEGDFSAQQLIKALDYEVAQKKEKSLKTGENKLSYMINSLSYLTQRGYEAFIELIDDNRFIQETQEIRDTTTDI
jgi:hypothetical protein